MACVEDFRSKVHLDNIVKAIEDARRLGLAVYIKDGKVVVCNTVYYDTLVDKGEDPRADEVAYAESRDLFTEVDGDGR